MLVVNGIVNDLPTVFVGINASDMRQILNRQPRMIPVAVEVESPKIEAQIVLVGGETDDDLHEQVKQLAQTLYSASEERSN